MVLAVAVAVVVAVIVVVVVDSHAAAAVVLLAVAAVAVPPVLLVVRRSSWYVSEPEPPALCTAPVPVCWTQTDRPFFFAQEPHRHKGIFVARGGKEDLLATANIAPGISVYGEKRITVENSVKNEDGTPAGKIEYRVWVSSNRSRPTQLSGLSTDSGFGTEPFPFQDCRWYPWRCRQHLHEARLQGSL